MSSNVFYDNIQKYLFQYVDLVEHSNSVGLTDRAVHAENLFSVLLNLVFGWKLKNANEVKVNQKSFDLIFESEGIFVQVTTTKSHQTKFNSTVKSFKTRSSGDGQFIVLFISKKVDDQLLAAKVIDGVTYEGYDIPKLLNKILYNCPAPEKLEAINSLLQKSVSPVLLKEQSTGLSNLPAVIPKQAIKIYSEGIYVKRTGLVEDLFGFVQTESGLLIGGPGFGKSYIIEELQRYCTAREIPCYIIRINDLTEGTNEEIGDELKMGDKWLEMLLQLSHETNKSILIFDAFDTAKDERLKANILKYIKKSLDTLSSSWNLLVSVRTYDATKSRKLLELFPNKDIRNSVSCRNFQIPELTELEIDAVFETAERFRILYKKFNPPLKKLLRTPYFLKLFEKLLDDANIKGLKFNSIETEEQLLEIFWLNNIEDTVDKELFLFKLTSQLAHSASLVCDRLSMLTETNSKTYEELTSLGVIEAVSVTRQKISFSHNILLDFAISKYLLKQDVKDQIAYIQSNEKMPFIFRQSFIYFYTKLYKSNNSIFWQHYHITAAKDEPLFRLLHQTTLNYVLISFYSTPEDLNPIFSGKDIEQKAQMLRKVLEGIRFITKGHLRKKDIDLILKISMDLHWLPLWEIGFLIEKGINLYTDNVNKSYLRKLSDASCNCLEFVLNNRMDMRYKALLDRNGGIRGIGNITKTFPLNLRKGKQLFLQILPILNEDDFPIDYFYHLGNHITEIYKHDKKLASRIYQTLYFHSETSDKETNMGNGVILALRSNRKQDYGMVYYVLEKSYKDLLKIDFYQAMKMGVEIVNKVNSFRRTTKRESTSLKIGEIDASIYSDYSFYDTDQDDGPSSHIVRIFEVLELNLASANYETGLAQLSMMIPEIKAAMVWRKLIKLMVTQPKITKDIAFDLLVNPEFYIFDETVYEAGELIKVVWPYFTTGKRKKVEETILGLKSAIDEFGRDGLAERRINKLLNCIPIGQIILQASKDVVEREIALENTPLVHEGGLLAADVRYSSRDELIKRAGFNKADDLDMLNYSRIEEIEAFNDKFENKDNKLTKKDFKSVIRFVELMFIDAASWTERKKRHAEYEIGRFAKVISSLGKKLNIYEQKLVKAIAVKYTSDKDYDAGEYETGDLKRSWGGFSPSAKTASVQTILNLVYTFNDKSLQSLLIKLMEDNVQIVRFKALHGLDYFWEQDKAIYWDKICERSISETDAMCLHKILIAVCYDRIMEQDRDKVEELANTIMLKMRDADDEIAREVWQVLIVVILKLVLHHESSRALELITANLDIKEFSRSMIFEIMNVIDPHSLENDYVSEPHKYDVLIKIILEILNYRFDRITTNGLAAKGIVDEFEIIDHVIQHLYFTIEKGRKGNKGNVVEDANMKEFYLKIKPILDFIVEQSTHIESGFMIAHTGYYFMQMLNFLLDLDPEHILYLSNTIVICAAKNGFTYDSSTLREIVELTENIIADHKEILYKDQNFKNLLVVLDQFSNSGWQEAMEMTWRLKEAF
ncbi:SMEK domain-containing protein [Pedobacter sp.]